MADTDVAPGAGPANLSRRQLLYSGAAASVAAAMPGTLEAGGDPGAWQAALDAYHAAARLSYAFYTGHLRPAYDAMCAEGYGWRASLELRAELMNKYEIDTLEQISGDLHEAQRGKLDLLIATPAPDLPALRTKLEISYRDIFEHEESNEDIVALLIVDARRLIPDLDPPG